MDLVELSALEQIASVSANDKVLVHNVSGDKVGWTIVGNISGSGWCGRRWALDASSPTGQAVGNINKLAELPDLLGLGGYLVQNNHSRRKLSPNNHYQFLGGGTAALDGTMGHYQWGWGTPFYYAFWVEGGYLYEAIDLVPIKGRYNYRIPVASRSASGFATIDRVNGNLVSYCNTSAQYRGGNNDSSKDSAFNTQLGVPASKMTANAFETAARLNGDRWCATFHGMEYITGALVRIIMGTRNVQASVVAALDSNGLHQGGLGTGVSRPTNWDTTWKYYPFLQMSAGAEVGDAVGTIAHTITGELGSESKTLSCFFGLKNWYHYLSNMCPSFVGEDKANNTMDFYATTVLNTVAFNNTTKDGKTKVCSSPACGGGWEYAKKINMDYLLGVATEIGGTESTYFCDGFYKEIQTSGLRLALLGGYADHGGRCGLSFLGASDAVSYSGAGCGSSLCEAAEDWNTAPFLAV